MIDILITTHNRLNFLKQTVESFIEKNRAISYRLFIIDDCSGDGTDQYLLDLKKRKLADIYLNSERRGVVFGLDMLWNCSDVFDSLISENQYLCYLQDDVVSKVNDWLLIALRAYEDMKERHEIGFFSGYHSPEHPVQQTINWNGSRIYVKKSNSGKNMIAEKVFWRSIGYVPRLNPDGTPRGMPDKGRGSHLDVYLEGCYSGSKFDQKAAAPNCSHNQGKRILVIPKLLEHLGEDRQYSTWQKDRL